MTASQRWWWLAIVLIASVLVWLLSPVLMPFAVAGLLAYLGSPLVGRLATWRVPRTVAAVLVLCLILLVLIALPLLAFPMLERQISLLLRNWPNYLAWTQDTLAPWLLERFDVDVRQAFNLEAVREALMQHWQLAGGMAARVLSAVSQSWLAVLAWLMNLVLIPVITFYLLRDWEVLMQRISALLPRYVAPTVGGLAQECNEMLASFLRGQLWVMVSLGIVYAVGLWIAGLDLALLIGIVAGAVSFVPYLGVIVGFGAAAIAGLVQFGDASILVAVGAVFIAGQLLESLVLTPLLVGDRIGLHPVAVIFAVLAGGQLFGALGVLLALPVATVIVVLLRYAHRMYLASHLYGEDKPAERDAGSG